MSEESNEKEFKEEEKEFNPGEYEYFLNELRIKIRDISFINYEFKEVTDKIVKEMYKDTKSRRMSCTF